MNIIPIALLKSMASVNFPWAWASEEKEKVYRRVGHTYRELDPEGYSDLYEAAGFGDDDDDTDPDPDPDPNPDPGPDPDPNPGGGTGDDQGNPG